MWRWSLFLCGLCCVMGLWMAKSPQPVGTASPSPAPTPRRETITVQQVVLHTAQRPTPAPEPPVTLDVLHDGARMEVALEDYLVYVVAGEMPASFEPEALCAQAVAARSYIAWKLPRCGGAGCLRGADICTDSTHCMAYMGEEEMRAQWGERYEEYRAKIASAVQATAGQVMLYEGRPVQALFHASSGGRTEDAQAVWGTALPYLTSVASAEEDTQRTVTLSRAQLAEKLNAAFDGAGLTKDNVVQQFVVRSRTPGGRADIVRVGRVTAAGRAVRSALGLSSTAFEVRSEGENVTITTQGYGHGVGMSQEGANAMAQQGKTWQDILLHYYTGVSIGKMP